MNYFQKLKRNRLSTIFINRSNLAKINNDKKLPNQIKEQNESSEEKYSFKLISKNSRRSITSQRLNSPNRKSKLKIPTVRFNSSKRISKKQNSLKEDLNDDNLNEPKYNVNFLTPFKVNSLRNSKRFNSEKVSAINSSVKFKRRARKREKHILGQPSSGKVRWNGTRKQKAVLKHKLSELKEFEMVENLGGFSALSQFQDNLKKMKTLKGRMYYLDKIILIKKFSKDIEYRLKIKKNERIIKKFTDKLKKRVQENKLKNELIKKAFNQNKHKLLREPTKLKQTIEKVSTLILDGMSSQNDLNDLKNNYTSNINMNHDIIQNETNNKEQIEIKEENDEEEIESEPNSIKEFQLKDEQSNFKRIDKSKLEDTFAFDLYEATAQTSQADLMKHIGIEFESELNNADINIRRNTQSKLENFFAETFKLSRKQDSEKELPDKDDRKTKGLLTDKEKKNGSINEKSLNVKLNQLFDIRKEKLSKNKLKNKSYIFKPWISNSKKKIQKNFNEKKIIRGKSEFEIQKHVAEDILKIIKKASKKEAAFLMKSVMSMETKFGYCREMITKYIEGQYGENQKTHRPLPQIPVGRKRLKRQKSNDLVFKSEGYHKCSKSLYDSDKDHLKSLK